MGNWAEQKEIKKELRERDRQTKDTIAKYFLDLSKLVFAAIVLGGFTPIFTDITMPVNWKIVCVGALSTVFLAVLGYRVLKQK